MTRSKEILHLFNIVAVPSEVYLDLDADSRWKLPLAFFLFISAITGYFMIPAELTPMRHVFESSFGEGNAEAAVAGVKLYLGLGEWVMKPLKGIVRWIFLSSFLSLLSPLVQQKASGLFGKMISVIAYTETVFLFMNVLTVLIIYMKGMDSIANGGDLVIFKGAEYFFHGIRIPVLLSGILSRVNIFSGWYVALLSLGVSIISRIERRKALIVAVTGWILWSCLDMFLDEAASGIL